MSCNWPQSKLALASRYSCTRSRTRDRSASDPPTSRAASNSTAGIRQFPKLQGVDRVPLELPSSIVLPTIVGWQRNFTRFAAPTPLPSDRVTRRQSGVPFDSLPSRARSSSPTTTPAEHGRDLVADLSRRKGYLVVTGKARRP